MFGVDEAPAITDKKHYTQQFISVNVWRLFQGFHHHSNMRLRPAKAVIPWNTNFKMKMSQQHNHKLNRTISIKDKYDSIKGKRKPWKRTRKNNFNITQKTETPTDFGFNKLYNN